MFCDLDSLFLLSVPDLLVAESLGSLVGVGGGGGAWGSWCFFSGLGDGRGGPPR